jgi:MFS transporter, ACS family, glucarate transporter
VVSVAFFALAVYGLELTVGVSWAVALDIGGEFAGSVSAVMNTLGNLGAAAAAAVTAYIVKAAGWSSAFYVIAGLSVLAAALYLGVDASRRAYRAAEFDARDTRLAPEGGLLGYEGL